MQSGEGMILKLERYAVHCLRKSILFKSVVQKKDVDFWTCTFD